MASLVDLRDALTALGVSTSTGQLRGEERRLLLQQRLHEAQRNAGITPSDVISTPSKTTEKERKNDQSSESDYHTLTLSELRAELNARKLPTQTPGLKGEARRHALLQRLLNAGGGAEAKLVQEPHNREAWEATSDGATSSRSSTSSYSTAGEFLFFDLQSDRRTQASDPPVPTIPVLSLPVSPLKRQQNQVKSESHDHTVSNEIDSFLVREQLERELMDLRQQLHQQRTARSLSISKRMIEAGFPQDLDTLSAAMQQFENERQRILRVAFACELVTTTAIAGGGSPVELVQEDSVRLIERQQSHLRQQIQRTKDAMAIVKQHHDVNQADHTRETEIQTAIRRIQLQLQLYQPSSRSTASSTSEHDSGRSTTSVASLSTTGTIETPMLTRCRSMPSTAFHEAWHELDDSQRQQLHLELKAAKSFRIRHDRVRVGDENARAIAARPGPGATPTVSSRQSILAFTRYPPTAADKLGVKALFLEQSNRSLLEIQRVYQQALALEPHHAIILGNYAGFLYQKCGQLDQSDQVFNQALRSDPLCITNIAAYAHFLHHTNRDLTKAEDLYIQLLRISPRDPVVLGSYASLLYRQVKKSSTGRTSQLLQAKQFLLQAIDMDGTSISNRLRLCAVYEELDETQEAHRCYEKLVKDVGQLRLGLGNQESQRTPRTAKTVALVAHVYGNFANFLQRSKQLEKAKSMYEAALHLHPEDKLLQRNFSMFLRDMNTGLKLSARMDDHFSRGSIPKREFAWQNDP